MVPTCAMASLLSAVPMPPDPGEPGEAEEHEGDHAADHAGGARREQEAEREQDQPLAHEEGDEPGRVRRRVPGAQADDEQLARLVKARIPATAAVREGGATREVLAVAKAKRADLIALGTRGRSGLASLVLGSVARGILHGSHTSLLVAPRRAR